MTGIVFFENGMVDDRSGHFNTLPHELINRRDAEELAQDLQDKQDTWGLYDHKLFILLILYILLDFFSAVDLYESRFVQQFTFFEAVEAQHRYVQETRSAVQNYLGKRSAGCR